MCMDGKRSKKQELRQLKAILRICTENAPVILKDQNKRIANKIKDLSKKRGKRKKNV